MERRMKNAYRNSLITCRENVPFKPSQRNVDRLSSLPDGVLCLILSLLPTKTSVATSVLAKRWRFIWTQVPVLNFEFRGNRKKVYSREYFDDCDLNSRMPPTWYPRDDYYRISWNETDCPRIGFSDIVQGVLLRHKVQFLSTFRLSYLLYDFTDYQIDTFIISAIARGVKVLDIDCDPKVPCYSHNKNGNKLPSSLFCFKPLVEFRLTGFSIRIKLDNFVSLPNLKKFHLINIHFGDDATFRKLISGCPILEELVVVGIDVKSISKWQLSSDLLKHLVVEIRKAPQGTQRRAQRATLGYDWQIYAPSLRYLKLCSVFPRIIWAPSLIEVHIQVNIPEMNYGFEEQEFFNFLNGLSNIQLMTMLCGIPFGDSNLEALTMQFRYLEKLCFDGHLSLLFKLLEHAENLAYLTRWQSNSFDSREHQAMAEKHWKDPVQVPKCLLSQLKNVECLHTETHMAVLDFKLIRYLLKNALVLDNIVIRTDPDYRYNEKCIALKTISSFQEDLQTVDYFSVERDHKTFRLAKLDFINQL